MSDDNYSKCSQWPDEIPYRMALAGGWIDQPFLSKLNPEPPGSMVVVSLEPHRRFQDRCGMATGTRKVATRLWKGRLPDGNPEELVRELYYQENQGRTEPSGSQDMIGLIYPGISRLDYDYSHEGGVFPRHIESNRDPEMARWLEEVLHVVPIAPRPEGYNPLGIKNLDSEWIRHLGQSGKDCYRAIVDKDIAALGASLNRCMECWAAILPHVIRHSTIGWDLEEILRRYQANSYGAMFSGCGGGYLYVVADGPVPNSFPVKIRVK